MTLRRNLCVCQVFEKFIQVMQPLDEKHLKFRPVMKVTEKVVIWLLNVKYHPIVDIVQFATKEFANVMLDMNVIAPICKELNNF